MLRQHQQHRGRMRLIAGSLVMLFIIVTVSDRTGALGKTLFTGGAGASKPATPLYVGPFDPFGADRDCRDFKTHAEAQAFFVAAGGPRSDPHRLDADHDGSACETLP